MALVDLFFTQWILLKVSAFLLPHGARAKKKKKTSKGAGENLSIKTIHEVSDLDINRRICKDIGREPGREQRMNYRNLKTANNILCNNAFLRHKKSEANTGISSCFSYVTKTCQLKRKRIKRESLIWMAFPFIETSGQILHF